jgi:uncharacterized protein YcbK (DUF882 family)
VGSCIGAVVLVVAGTGAVGNAVANGDTRTLEIYHTHTKERASITYKRNGSFDKQGLDQLNWILRDWRQDQPTAMDPRLFDIVWEVRREAGSDEPLNVVSAYRAPETNAMLRRRSRAVAKHSQHMLGKAMDFFLPDVSMAKVREIGLVLQRGGVGYYPTAYNPFVHLDAGSVRHWPRLTRDQLTRLFPDGKTVHLPTDGKPMPRYEEAAAEVVANGGTVFAYASGEGEEGAGVVVSQRSGKSFFAALFGIGDDEDAEFARPRGTSRRVAATRTAQTYAYAPTGQQDDRYVASMPQVPEALPLRGRRAAPRVETVMESSPPPAPAPVAVASLSPEMPAPAAVAAVAPPPASPAPRFADVPIPVTRPDGLGTPPGWQQGPAGQVVETGARFASVPLPPLRPSDLLASASPVYANVPLPPARPVEVASLAPVRAPQPTLSDTAASYAPAMPAPAMRPSYAAHIAEADPSSTSSLDKTGLNALFAATTIGPGAAHPSRAPVKTARARTTEREIAGSIDKPAVAVAMRFGGNPAPDLRSDRFSGPAVKPVASFNFSR